MAKIASAERERRAELYDALVLKIFLAEGWNAITYDRIAKELNIRKSTLQAYYPSKDDFANALRGKVLPILMQNLKFDSPETFVESWKKAVCHNHSFKLVIQMLISNMINQPHEMSTAGLTRLTNLLAEKFGQQQAQQITTEALGFSLLALAGLV